MQIGILALQGSFRAHAALLAKMGIPTTFVTTPQGLAPVDGLIIPGGESTTMATLIEAAELKEPLITFAAHKPVLGTCAGMILMAKEVTDHSVPTLGLIDMRIRRNASGRQKHSHKTTLYCNDQPIEALFIRAPKIESFSPQIKVLIWDGHTPVCVVQEERLFAASFHPELTQDETIHSLFLSKVKLGATCAEKCA